jgi:hypothetical protein
MDDVILVKEFKYFLNEYFRQHRFNDPEYHDIQYNGEQKERPINLEMNIIQSIKPTKILTKEILFMFFEWYEKERLNEDIEDWRIISPNFGEIMTNFGKVSFSTNGRFEDLIIEIN